MGPSRLPPAAAACLAVFLCPNFIGEEGDTDADPEREC